MTLKQENALLTLITAPLEKLNRRAIEEAARQLKKIGTLSAKNIDQLNLQYEAGTAASEIISAVARAADMTVRQVFDVLETVAKAEYAASEPLFAFRGIDQVPYEKNASMRRNVRAIARRTCETMTNVSLTRGQSVGLKTSQGFLPLNKAYPQIVDEGIQSAVFGGKSYDEATKETIKTFGGSGLRVRYDSGNTRRLDSAVRMNVLDGIRSVNAEVQREISETIRADKVEISVHLPPLYCAPDHIEYQGLVMTREELETLNSTTLAYPKRAIAVGALNCRHYTLAFLDGISKPRHTPEQLAEIVKSAKEIHEVAYTDLNGRERTWKGTIYEATQVQRQMETALRNAKETRVAAEVVGNQTLSSELRREITARNKEYESFSGAIGLKAQAARTRIAAKNQGGDREGDLSDGVRRAAKSVAERGRVVGFNSLPKDCRDGFREGLAKAAPEAKELLRREYSKADYIVSQGKRSYYRGLSDVVEIGKDAPPSTLAHELFHRLDKGNGISKTLASGLAQDHVALNVVSGGDIKSYLAQRYPTAFVQDTVGTDVLFKEKYRGISDILNGMYGGKVDFGFGHRASYWAEPGTLEAEAWAQFGRIQFKNSSEVLKMLSDLFPNLEKSAMIALKGLI